MHDPHTEATAPELFVDVTELPGGCRLVVAGSIDVSTAPRFRGALQDAIDRGGDVEVDLYQVAFMDSQGLNALCTANAGVRGDQTLRLCDSSPQVRRLLEITSLDEVFGLDNLHPPRHRVGPA